MKKFSAKIFLAIGWILLAVGCGGGSKTASQNSVANSSNGFNNISSNHANS